MFLLLFPVLLFNGFGGDMDKSVASYQFDDIKLLEEYFLIQLKVNFTLSSMRLVIARKMRLDD